MLLRSFLAAPTWANGRCIFCWGEIRYWIQVFISQDIAMMWMLAFLCVIATVVSATSVSVKEAELTFDGTTVDVSKVSTDHVSEKTLGISYELSMKDGDVVTPHQNFLRLSHVESGVSSVFVLKGSGSTYKATVSVLDEAESLMYKSGDYAGSLLIGGPSLEPLEYPLGTFTLMLPVAPPKTELPLYHRPLLHDSDTTLTALPEIKHAFRPAQPDPSPVLPYLFSLVVVVAVVGLQIGFIQAGGNITNLMVAPVESHLFGFCLGGILMLFGNYWLRSTMADLLTYLCPVVVLTVLCGHRCLSRLAAARIVAEAATSAESGKHGKKE